MGIISMKNLTTTKAVWQYFAMIKNKNESKINARGKAKNLTASTAVL